MQEVVKVQRKLLDADLGEDYEDEETWSLAQVTHECMNPVTTKKTLRVRFNDDHEQDFYEGSMHRTSRAPRLYRRLAATAALFNSPFPSSSLTQSTCTTRTYRSSDHR
jgi:hypothetical protein